MGERKDILINYMGNPLNISVIPNVHGLPKIPIRKLSLSHSNNCKMAGCVFLIPHVMIELHYLHTFEVDTKIHPHFEGIDDTSLNGLLHDSEVLEGHAFWSYHVITLYQFLQ